MAQFEIWGCTPTCAGRTGAAPPPPPVDARSSESPADAVVHIVDVDEAARRHLSTWLAAAGIESRIYPDMDAFLSVRQGERPGCLVVDAALSLANGLEPRRMSCPVVVTALQADVSTAVRAMKSGAVDFLEKPLRESDILHAVRAAISLDREQRPIALRRAEFRTRFARLSRRERQVMALVTAGKMNKQVAGDLGLSEITVKAHRGSVMRKMGVRTLADLVRIADVVAGDLAPYLENIAPPSRNSCLAPVRSAAGADPRSGCSRAYPY